MTTEEKMALLEAEVKTLRENNPLYIKQKRLAEVKLALEVLQNKEKVREIEAENLRNSEEYIKIDKAYGQLRNGMRTQKLIDAEDQWYIMQSRLKALTNSSKGEEKNLQKEKVRLIEEIAQLNN